MNVALLAALTGMIGLCVGFWTSAVLFTQALRHRSAAAPAPANPAVAALDAALAGRPDPRAPRDPAAEPEYVPYRRPRLPEGL